MLWRLSGKRVGAGLNHGVVMAQLEHIEAIERRLWSAADTLRANSSYASNEYFLPVMGLIFLRHAYSRFLELKDEIEANLPARGGKKRALRKEDFSQKSAIYLRPEAQFDQLVSLPDNADRVKAIREAMESIEEDYDSLKGVLPKNEYQELDNDVLAQLLGKGGYVMANPPFNVDEIDADKVKSDPRLPFGLPGVNKNNKVSNGNYIWISYFYSYLNERGRAGFVMSSQASSAGRGEAQVRQALVEADAVDIMVAIRSNFFYTRTVPCELWFLNRDKPEEHRDKVLMLDARNIYRQVTRKIYDFSPEQEKNLLAVVWLYRGQAERYLGLVSDYCQRTLDEGEACFDLTLEDGEEIEPLPDFVGAVSELRDSLDTLPEGGPQAEPLAEFEREQAALDQEVAAFRDTLAEQQTLWKAQDTSNGGLKETVDRLKPLADASRDLVKQADMLFKLASTVVETAQTTPSPQPSPKGRGSGDGTAQARRRMKAADEARQLAVERLRQVRYLWKQAHWLTERFPEAKLRDVEGLVKLVDRSKIEANDWSLTPGRYVGVAPEDEDEGFDFEEALRAIHSEIADLNAESATLAATIQKNFEELGV